MSQITLNLTKIEDERLEELLTFLNTHHPLRSSEWNKEATLIRALWVYRKQVLQDNII
ncbi:MAG: hypothetical protein FWH53_00270 [Leptospirales bacterium]|nr:hypothetical protein [Leptospirales bacterium]